ncbi:hypothetical protein RRG08_023273 [Elysia crispata]|uniref:Ig-like domain-containing protein n=1 Tax=Elysia crispata TaxID=231223 RepID=A0AAE1ARF2_9GAST|nr:hypothetical protein RRG08_023273 [Elysia crispata]
MCFPGKVESRDEQQGRKTEDNRSVKYRPIPGFTLHLLQIIGESVADALKLAPQSLHVTSSRSMSYLRLRPVQCGKTPSLEVSSLSMSPALPVKSISRPGVGSTEKRITDPPYGTDSSAAAHLMLDKSRAGVQSCKRSGIGRNSITVCDKLEVYALPESPSCTVSEVPESGDIKSVNVSCSTSKVYPKARCRFYREKDGGNLVEITNPIYSHTETVETPVYYRSQCSVSVSVQELGEGTHSFIGYIYPGVTGGSTKVIGTLADKTVTLSFSQASHSCRPEAVQGYFLEESTTCTCSLISDGHPRGTAEWYKGGQQVGSSGTLVVSRDKSNPDSVQTYTCEAVSDLGRKAGTTLKAKFAYVPEVTFTLEPALTTFNKGDNLELKCSGQGNPDPILTLITKETTDDLTNVETTELTHTLTLDCMDTGVYVCSGQNSQGTNRTESSIGVRCSQKLSPLFNKTPQVDAVIGQMAHFGIEIYGFPEPSTLTLRNINDDTNLTPSPRHSVEYTAGVPPFGVVNVTISDVVEADLTIYTLTVDNGVGNALIYPFYMNQVDTSAHVESIVTKEDSLNISSIVIGVIAVVIFACLIVVIIFLLKKIRGLKKERLDSQYKVPLESKPQSHQNDDYLVPFEMSTITTPVSARLPPRQGQYETVDNIPATTDTTPVSASLPPRPGQYETVDNIPTTTDTTNVSTSKLPQPRHYETSDDITSATPASAKFTRGTAQYETIQDMATIPQTYNSTSRQDVDPLNVYQDLEPNHLTSGDLGSSGPYSNVPGQHEEKLRNPAINYANADMSCLKGNYQNKKVTKQAYQNVEMK